MDKKRVIERKINELLQMFPAVAIIGPRQCGKSTLVKNLKPTWKYFDLERPSDFQLIEKDPQTFLKLNSEEIIIDEAQEYPEFFKVLRTAIDENRKSKGRFLLTGSSSPEIVKGLTESLAGRVAIVEMAPFKVCEYAEQPVSSLYEILGEKRYSEIEGIDSAITLKESLEFWFKGGFPEPALEDRSDRHFYSQWMENYISAYISRDIRALFPRLNIHSFKRFLTLLSQFSGHQLNTSSIARSLGISASTVKDYLDIIHQTFIWRNLPPFEKNHLKKIQKSSKGFFRDQGILHYFLKINCLEDLLIHPVAGFSYESFVIEELIRGFNQTMMTQVEYSYYRTVDKSEVDLIVDSPAGIIPVEIKLASSATPRDLRSLEILISDLKLDLGLLINNGDRIMKLAEKIYQIPVNYI